MAFNAVGAALSAAISGAGAKPPSLGASVGGVRKPTAVSIRKLTRLPGNFSTKSFTL